MPITIELTKKPKQKPLDESSLGFGQTFSDHMLIMNYTKGIGWHDMRIIPYGPFMLAPSCMCFHYAQEIFEGLKAYRTSDNKIQLFRPMENFKRLNQSNSRLAIPEIDEELCLKGLIELVKIDKDWVPKSEGTSLYIRPFIIATDEVVGVRPSNTYIYAVILSPSGAYYSTGINPVKIAVADKYVRSVKGGTGAVKTGGNYAASLIAQEEAHSQGYSQVLWLDGVENKYIEEVGAMNVFFQIGDEIITPELTGSLLPGITRKSVIELARSWGLKVTERRISIDELIEAGENGTLKEGFGSGTAAVVSPIGEVKYKDKIITINNGEIGKNTQRIYDELTGIQFGKTEDKFGWIVPVCEG